MITTFSIPSVRSNILVFQMLEAIIQVRFKRSPGHAKVRSGEYELFMGGKGSPTGTETFISLPGSVIVMTLVVGQYAGSTRCPRVGCKSKNFLPSLDKSRKRW